MSRSRISDRYIVGAYGQRHTGGRPNNPAWLEPGHVSFPPRLKILQQPRSGLRQDIPGSRVLLNWLQDFCRKKSWTCKETLTLDSIDLMLAHVLDIQSQTARGTVNQLVKLLQIVPYYPQNCAQTKAFHFRSNNHMLDPSTCHPIARKKW